jgi:hypothetical protein
MDKPTKNDSDLVTCLLLSVISATATKKSITYSRLKTRKYRVPPVSLTNYRAHCPPVLCPFMCLPYTAFALTLKVTCDFCDVVLSYCHFIYLSEHRRPSNVSREMFGWLKCRYMINVCLLEAVLAVSLHHSSELVDQSLLLLKVSRSRSVKHICLVRTPLDQWSALRKGTYIRPHHLQETDFHAPGGIRTLQS